MRTARLAGDLGLLEQGVEVAVGFGMKPLEGLLGVAELIKSTVYEPHSLRATPDGLEFTLLNPPLRMGAFSAVRLFVGGEPVPGTDAWFRWGPTEARRFDSVALAHPVSIPVGERTVVGATWARPRSGRLRLRLELQSIAIPPLVWMQFEDELAASGSTG